jgi:two-component system, NarL family, response regulator DevR
VTASSSAPQTDRSASISVMIIDDHEVVRRGIAEVIERADGMTVVA